MYQFQCDAILFDLDGVLVNSNAAVERHWRDWAAAHGLDGYLQAAQRLGFAPEHCLVIEDAVAGVRAARAAGMQVIAVATTYPPEELSEADACVPALVGVTIAHYNTEGRPNLEVLFAN
jgi:beta-phosphoglucomutase-like phosphatase (HAD superfamily)